MRIVLIIIIMSLAYISNANADHVQNCGVWSERYKNKTWKMQAKFCKLYVGKNAGIKEESKCKKDLNTNLAKYLADLQANKWLSPKEKRQSFVTTGRDVLNTQAEFMNFAIGSSTPLWSKNMKFALCFFRGLTIDHK